MDENKAWHILQIIPAQVGWKAVHCQVADSGQLEILSRAIVCWALVESTGGGDVGRTQVRGVVQQSHDLAVVGESYNTELLGEDGMGRKQYFLGYDDPEAHKESHYWITQGNGRHKTETDKRSMKTNGSGVRAETEIN